MGLNFFNDKFLIKSTFLKVKGRYIHRNRFAFAYIFANFITCTFLSINFQWIQLTFLGKKIIFFREFCLLVACLPVACPPSDCLPVACLPVACLPVACLSVRLSPVCLSPVFLSPVFLSPVFLSPVFLSPVCLSSCRQSACRLGYYFTLKYYR